MRLLSRQVNGANEKESERKQIREANIYPILMSLLSAFDLRNRIQPPSATRQKKIIGRGLQMLWMLECICNFYEYILQMFYQTAIILIRHQQNDDTPEWRISAYVNVHYIF